MSQSNQKEMTMQWPLPGAFRKSIRREFSIYVAAFILIIMLVTGYVITPRFQTGEDAASV